MKKIAFLLVVVLLLLALQPVQGQEGVSRGGFAAMLVEAGKMESDLPPADLLVQKGIMKGYPDGELYLERAIKRMEAVALVARTLGAARGCCNCLRERSSFLRMITGAMPSIPG